MLNNFIKTAMEFKNEIIDTMISLKSHTFRNLYMRFIRNVNTENMPSWDNVWKAYHLHNGLKNLRK